MRLNMIKFMHETTMHRFETRLESKAGGFPNHRHQRTEGRPGGAIASVGRHHLGTDCQPAGGGTGLGAPAAAAVSPRRPSAFRPTEEMGRATTGVADLGRRTSLPSPLARTSPAGRSAGRFPVAGGSGRTAGPEEGGSLGGVPLAGPAWMAQGGSRHPASQERPRRPGGMEKKLPETLATLLTPEAVAGRRVRWMFQDEARFGRMVRPKRCWEIGRAHV